MTMYVPPIYSICFLCWDSGWLHVLWDHLNDHGQPTLVLLPMTQIAVTPQTELDTDSNDNPSASAHSHTSTLVEVRGGSPTSEDSDEHRSFRKTLLDITSKGKDLLNTAIEESLDLIFDEEGREAELARATTHELTRIYNDLDLAHFSLGEWLGGSFWASELLLVIDARWIVAAIRRGNVEKSG